MKKKMVSLFILGVLCASLSVGAKNGCTAFEKTGAGALLGAAAGAGIGVLTGNWELGTAIGAGAGALAGAFIGSQKIEDDDAERLKRLSGLIMSADELNKNLAFIGISPEIKNAIMVDINTILRNAPDAMFTVDMNGRVVRHS